MNKFYFTTALVCTSLSLSACAKDLYDNTTPKPVVTDDKVEVLVEVQNQGTSNTTENITLELDIQRESKEKTVYEVWENYAPRQDYDETETEPSYSDPAFTTAINPVSGVKAKPKASTKQATKPKTSETVKIENPIVEDIVIIEKPEKKPEDNLDVFTPITTKPVELTQEQKDAAAALLPPDIVPPPPADDDELIILRRENQNL